jgi:hypothetical protein
VAAAREPAVPPAWRLPAIPATPGKAAARATMGQPARRRRCKGSNPVNAVFTEHWASEHRPVDHETPQPISTALIAVALWLGAEVLSRSLSATIHGQATVGGGR